MFTYPWSREWPKDVPSLVKFVEGGHATVDYEVTPPPPNFVEDLKKLAAQASTSWATYLRDPSLVAVHEWGFLAAGLAMGSVSALVFVALALQIRAIGEGGAVKAKAE